MAALVGLTGGLLLSIPLSRSLNSDSRSSLLLPFQNPFSSWSGFEGRELVVLGRDSSGHNTDAIFTVHVGGGRTTITQIPRDSYIDADGIGPLKVNALLSRGGPRSVERELTRLLDRPIHHHIVVNLNAIQILGDKLGGIEIEVPKRMYYVDHSQGLVIDLQPGRQLLKGNDLEGFLRWRNDDRGDFGRLERQQLALRGLFDQVKSPQNLIRLPELISTAVSQVQTDLGPMELGGLITAMTSTDLDTRRLRARPFSRGGISYLETEWTEEGIAEGPK